MTRNAGDELHTNPGPCNISGAALHPATYYLASPSLSPFLHQLTVLPISSQSITHKVITWDVPQSSTTTPIIYNIHMFPASPSASITTSSFSNLSHQSEFFTCPESIASANNIYDITQSDRQSPHLHTPWNDFGLPVSSLAYILLRNSVITYTKCTCVSFVNSDSM